MKAPSVPDSKPSLSGLLTPHAVGVAVGVFGTTMFPTRRNIWSFSPAGLLVQKERRSQLRHAGPKPPPGLRHAAGPVACTVRSVHPHCPLGVKSILACTETK